MTYLYSENRLKTQQELLSEGRNLPRLICLQIIGKIKRCLKSKKTLKNRTQFEIIIQNQNNLLENIYRLLLKYDTEAEKIKNYIIKWMKNWL